MTCSYRWNCSALPWTCVQNKPSLIMWAQGLMTSSETLIAGASLWELPVSFLSFPTYTFVCVPSFAVANKTTAHCRTPTTECGSAGREELGSSCLEGGALLGAMRELRVFLLGLSVIAFSCSLRICCRVELLPEWMHARNLGLHGKQRDLSVGFKNTRFLNVREDNVRFTQKEAYIYINIWIRYLLKVP